MSILKNLISGIKALLHKNQRSLEMDEELRAFQEASAEEKTRSGLSPHEAQRAARIEMGSIETVKEKVRSSTWESTAESIAHDIRFSLRMMAKSPGFTAVAILSLALGIGANTAIFTLLNAIMLRPLPVQNPQQLVLFGAGKSVGSNGSLPNGSSELFSYPFYQEFRNQTDVFSGVVAMSSVQFGGHASIAGAPVEQVHIDLVSGTYFPLLGVPPALGRTLSEADDQAAGSGPVAVVSYNWWQNHLGGDPSALGRTVNIQSHPYTIIGVAQPGFLGTTVGRPADLWIPLSMQKEISPGWNGLDDKFFQSLYLIARLKPGVTAEQASVHTNLLFKRILRSDYVGSNPSQKELDTIEHARIDLTPFANGLSPLRPTFSVPLEILMAIVGLVLLIACANIANMLLARGVARAREVAVRMALGASRARIVLQLLIESTLLACIGAALGMALAWKASSLLLRMATSGPRPIPIDVTPDLRVLSFTLLLTVLTALLFGIMPALRATSLQLTPALKKGPGSIPVTSRSNLAHGLITGQIALSILLLAAAGLFLRSLVNLTSVDTGFDRNNVLVFSLDEYAANLPADSHLVQLQQQIETRVQTLPGVQAASFSMFTFNQGMWSDPVTVQGASRTPENNHDVLYNVVGDGFFSTIGLPLQAGRWFTPQDNEHAPQVAIINETMQRRFFPDSSAIGRRFGLGDDPAHGGDIEIIGVVKDGKYVALGETKRMAAYFPYTQRIQYFSNFSVRYSGDRQQIISAVRQAIAQVNPNILVSNISTLAEQVNASIATQKLVTQLSVVFGMLAILLSSIGIYGVMTYNVVRRTNEIGIRIALGAQSSGVLWMILKESLILLAIGVALGIPATLAATRTIKSQLFGLSPTDPLTFIAAALAISVVTLLAAWFPAHRATKVDPIIALRYE
jgi:predicted permease